MITNVCQYLEEKFTSLLLSENDHYKQIMKKVQIGLRIKETSLESRWRRPLDLFSEAENPLSELY